MRPKTKVYAVIVTALLAFMVALIPVAAGAGSITLTPTAQAPGASVIVSGSGFGPTKAVGLGLGAETNVTGEAVSATGPYDTDVGPYVYPVTYRPIKPGSFQMDSGYMAGGSYIPTFLYWDNGNGTISTNNTAVTSAAIDYVTGKVSFNFTAPLSSSVTYLRTAKYTHYQYNVTPVAGVTTDSSGAFAALIAVPAVANGSYIVIALDTQGNLASSTLNVNSAIPEVLPFGAVILLSSVAVIVGSWHFRKRPITN
jgi:hypothetical protein